MILTEKKNDIVLRDYQQEAVSFLNDNDGKLILAMCPSSGKTETIIYYLNQQYNINPNLKVLILPHSTNVLLTNFYERLGIRNVDFTYSSDINDDVNVHIILPQNHHKIVGHYDLIIIDEAQENYLAKTIQGIIKKTQVHKEILLTGTPSKFVDNNDFKLHFVALSDLCELYTPKLRIDILESDYDWNGNYNTSKELKNEPPVLTYGHYGCYKSNKDAIIEEFDENVDLLVLIGGDVVTDLSPDEFHDKVMEAYRLGIKHNAGLINLNAPCYLSGGDWESMSVDYGNWVKVPHFMIGDIILIFKSERENIKHKLNTAGWHSFDIWMAWNYHDQVTQFTSKKSLAYQLDGYSVLDYNEKKW